MPTVLDATHIVVEALPKPRVLVVTRKKTRPKTAEDLRANFVEALAMVDGNYNGWGLVLDMRNAPGRNEAAFETGMTDLRVRLRELFFASVTVMGSAVGTLQAERLAREEGYEAAITTDLDEAIRQVTPPT